MDERTYKGLLTTARPDAPSALVGMAQVPAPPPQQVMAAAVESTSFEEGELPSEREAMTWKHKKEYFLKNISNHLHSESEESEFSHMSHNENDVSGSPVCSHLVYPDMEDLDDDVSSVPEAESFPELQTASVYEAEDWDKELEEAECSPYDDGDFYWGSFQENNLLTSYSWREDSFYNPGCHHAACLAFVPPVRITETGQFDDADE